MKHKTNSQSFWIIGVLIIASVLLAAFAFYPNITNHIGDIQLTKDNLKKAGRVYVEPAQSAFHNGNISLKGDIEAISVGNEKTEVIGCFDLPDTGPWDPDAILTVNGKKYEWIEFRLLNPKDPSTYSSNHRCYLLVFPYTYEGKIKLKIRLSVSLIQEINRGLLDADSGNKVKSKLQQNYPGLDFDVITESGVYGGGAYIVFKSKPAGMSDNEALALIDQAMIERHPGNWDFNVSIP